ncbi:MAG: Xaa-Pro peptidase family protein [Kiritimatiellia bacterium]|nr:Xaa-Pro peptidase family protein [Kiritimatiellia bacterium]
MKNAKKSTTADLFFGPPTDEAELRYFSGFLAPDPFALIRLRGRTHLVVNAMEEGRARREKNVENVWSPSALGFSDEARPTAEELIRAAAKKLKIEAVNVSGMFPLGLAEKLRAKGLKVIHSSRDFHEGRSVKTEREIRLIARAQKAAADAIRRARKILIEAGTDARGRLFWNGKILTAEILRGEIEAQLLRADYVCEGTIVACGKDGADPHERGAGPLRAGQFIVLDIFPRKRTTGYWGDITRTVIKGTATVEQKRRFRAVCRAQRVALRMIRPGAVCADVHQAVVRSFEQDGYPRTRVNGRLEGFIHGTGHGVGLEIHEAPRLAMAPQRLCAGNVVTVEPGLYSRSAGGLRMEDLVVVTKTGYRKLADAPRGLILP